MASSSSIIDEQRHIICISSSESEFSDEESTTDGNSAEIKEMSNSDSDIPLEPVVSITEMTDDDEGDWQNTDFEPEVFNFTDKEHINIHLDDDSTAEDVFSEIFDENILLSITYWVNQRAADLLQSNTLKSKSNLMKWDNLNVFELKKFLGLCIIVGNIHMPTLRHYWSQNEIYRHPVFGKTLSRNRFENILRCLCFCNSETLTGTGKNQQKISNILNHIFANIKCIYQPSQNLVLHEPIVFCNEKLYLKQSNYKKNHNNDDILKFYELCTFDGYILNLSICNDEQTSLQSQLTEEKFSIVEELMKDYYGKGHKLYVDSCYSSVALAKYLLDRQTYICGPLNPKRIGNPKVIIDTKLQTNETIWQTKNNIIVQKFKRKQDIVMISTFHKPENVEKSNRILVQIEHPILLDYRNMSRRDPNEELISFYSLPKKSIPWHIKAFFHILDISIWNSYWLVNKHRKCGKYVDFREELATSLLNLQKVTPGVAIPPPPTSEPTSEQHFPVLADKRKRCRQCYVYHKRKHARYVCNTCLDSRGQVIGLCVEPCFQQWHTQNNLCSH